MRISIKKTVFVSALAGCTALSLYAQTEPSTPGQSSSEVSSSTSMSDSRAKTFLKQAAKENQKEMAFAEIAAQKAENPELKSFAQKLQQDHTQAYRQIQALAQKHDVDLAEARQARTSREVTKFQDEQAGAELDQKLAKELLKDHANTIQRFHQASQNVQAQDVKQFAQTQIPALKQHFQQARSIAQSVGVDESTIASYTRQLPSAMGGTGESQLEGTSSGTPGESGPGTTQGAGATNLKSGTLNQ